MVARLIRLGLNGEKKPNLKCNERALSELESLQEIVGRTTECVRTGTSSKS